LKSPPPVFPSDAAFTNSSVKRLLFCNALLFSIIKNSNVPGLSEPTIFSFVVAPVIPFKE
jgi:hypothetical protein